jgi:hypothetical protein
MTLTKEKYVKRKCPECKRTYTYRLADGVVSFTECPNPDCKTKLAVFAGKTRTRRL